MMTKAIIRLVIAAMLFVLAAAPAAWADSSTAQLRASVNVEEYISVDMQHQRQTLTITPEDIARGYVEVSRATVFTVRTNSRDGYMLYFENTAPLFSKVVLIDNGRRVELSGAGGIIHQSYAKGQTKELSYRFFLSADAKPQTYQWPLRMEANTY